MDVFTPFENFTEISQMKNTVKMMIFCNMHLKINNYIYPIIEDLMQ